MTTSFSITCLLVVVGVLGKLDLAADIGITQGAVIATFYAFSANARNLLLNKNGLIKASDILLIRLLLIPFLASVSFVLIHYVTPISFLWAGAIILRRCSEWISEIHICQMEVDLRQSESLRFLVIQFALFWIVVASIFCNVSSLLEFTLFGWALSPVLLSIPFILRQKWSTEKRFRVLIAQLLPHFGSSVVIGLSIYIARAFLLVLIGKTSSGELFTALSLGGFLASLFANVFGPTLALQSDEQKNPKTNKYLKWFLLLIGLVGAVLLLSLTLWPDIAVTTKRSFFFWKTTALSLIGAAIMVKAHEIRIRLLQHTKNVDVFGPDLVIHVVLITTVPALYYLGSTDFLSYFYILNSCIALLVYLSVEINIVTARRGLFFQKHDSFIIFLICLSLSFPLFFQLTGHIFHNEQALWDSGGNFRILPVPISVIGCYFGIFILGRYQFAKLSLSVVFFMFFLMFFTSVISTDGSLKHEQGKIVLFMQFIVPVFSLVLGQSIASISNSQKPMTKAFLLTLVVILPTQIVSTLLSGQYLLSHSMFLFSIYQHWQYVPLILCCLLLYIVFAQWYLTGTRKILLLLIPLTGVYTAASLSMLSMFALWFGLILACYYWWSKRVGTSSLLLVTIVTLCCSFLYLGIMRGNVTEFHKKFGGTTHAGGQHIAAGQNIRTRLDDWQYYGSRIIRGQKKFWVGHPKPPARSEITSAHNYYLDLVYNFGILATLPLVLLILYTLTSIVRQLPRIMKRQDLFGLSFVVLYLVLIDSNFKVTLRQPYPGIIAFFLWGYLLQKLQYGASETPPGDLIRVKTKHHIARIS